MGDAGDKAMTTFSSIEKQLDQLEETLGRTEARFGNNESSDSFASVIRKAQRGEPLEISKRDELIERIVAAVQRRAGLTRNQAIRDFEKRDGDHYHTLEEQEAVDLLMGATVAADRRPAAPIQKSWAECDYAERAERKLEELAQAEAKKGLSLAAAYDKVLRSKTGGELYAVSVDPRARGAGYLHQLSAADLKLAAVVKQYL
jgi:antitoxin (DNA-binding transcriptional repressor) of toxin-antitoxin stability system